MRGAEPVSSLVREARLCSGDAHLAEISDALASGRTVVAPHADGWSVLDAAQCIGHAPSRRLVDIRGARARVVAPTATVAEVAASIDDDHRYVLVADGATLLGIVEAADLARAMAPGVLAPEDDRRALAGSGVAVWRASHDLTAIIACTFAGDWESVGGTPTRTTWEDAIDPSDHGALASHHRAAVATGHSVAILRSRGDHADEWVEDRAWSAPGSGVVQGVCWRVGPQAPHWESVSRSGARAPDVVRLANGVASELRESLATIGSSADALSSAGHSGPEIDLLRRALAEARALCRDLAFVGERGERSLAAIDLDAVVGSHARTLRGSGADRIGVELASARALVLADRDHVAEILSHLAEFARLQSAAGAPAVLFTRAAPGDRVEIGVRLRRAIPLEQRVALFDAYAADVVPPRLGLAVVRGIARQNGWTATVAPASGETTEVIVSLPVASTRRDSGPILLPDGFPDGIGTVLIAQVDRRTRATLRHSLSLEGWIVVEASDGHEALELVRRVQAPIRLLIADALMEGASGEDVAEALTARFADAAIVITSGHHGPGAVLERCAGAVLLPRPYDDAALADAIRRACRVDRRPSA